MYRVAIIDDNISVIFKIEKVLQKIMKDKGTKLVIHTYACGEEFLKIARDKNKYDIIFLDINLKKACGIEIAKKIREFDKLMKIIFISYETSHALQLFDANPYNFLVKPLDENKIENIMMEILNLLGNNKEFFEFKIKHSRYKIPIEDIVFFENYRRKVKLMTKDEEIFIFYEKMDHVEERLEEQNEFLRIHQSYIVNYSFVKIYHYDAMELFNGLTLPISLSYRKNLKGKILKL